jgi:hypothetical protein
MVMLTLRRVRDMPSEFPLQVIRYSNTKADPIALV